jgi:hypothetical protein
MIQILSNLIRQATTTRVRTIRRRQLFDDIVGYEGIKRTFIRSLNSDEPVHVLVVGYPSCVWICTRTNDGVQEGLEDKMNRLVRRKKESEIMYLDAT